MDLIVGLNSIYPELLLALGAFALLMFGVFAPEDDATSETVGWLAILLLIGAGILIALQPPGTTYLFNETFVSDRFARFMKLLALAGSAGALLLSFDYMRTRQILRFEYPILVVLATIGMMLMISANDLLALYLGIELQSLALYVMAAIRRDHVKSSEAGLKYFVLGALSSSMLLYGISLIYGFTGATGFNEIAVSATAQAATDNVGLVVGLVFLLVGLAFKVSAVPFHMWTPDVYEGAPTPVTAFFAAAPKIAAMALLLRAMAGGFPGFEQQWQQIIVFMSIASMLLGAFAAIGQDNIKRMMAYSSIANIGFALVGLSAGSQEGAQGVLIYMAIYLVMTLGAFACILTLRRGDTMVEDIPQLAGLSQTNLPLAFAFGVLMFSLAGIPPFAGFWGKFYVFSAAIKEGLYALAVIGVIASVIGAYYYLRIVKVMFFDAPAERFAPVPQNIQFVVTVSAFLVIGFIVYPSPLVDAADLASKTLRL